ncbi:MAG: AEC family transporter [Mogibacterium sp.]|nr:AEC family transporter [Mogibacterium sp.]
MEYALIILKQTIVMFLYMFAGYIMFRTRKMTVAGGEDIANLLVRIVIPAVIINSFCVEYSSAKLVQLLQSAFLSALGIGIAMLIAALFFRNHPVDNFGSAFSNAGFIGIPLIQAAFGDEGVFNIVAIVAMMNMMQWSYGVKVITGKKSAVSARRLFINPIFISIVIGLALFLTRVGAHLPVILSSALTGMSALNAPLAMLVMGSYLAQSDMKKMLTTGHLYLACAVRLLIIPAITLLIFRFIPFNKEMILAVYIALSTPMGANVAVYARLYNGDYPYACQAVTLSTLLSIITLPVVIVAASLI